MLALTELQKQFAHALNDEDNQILHQIQASDRLNSQDHLAIYQCSVFGALQNVLKEIYPVILKLVGEDFFLGMVNQYIHVTPSYSPDIGDYGVSFADFIAEFPPANCLPYLADVARLEWAWHRIFEAAHAPGLDFQKLAECYETMGEKIIFTLPPQCFLLHSIYPIHQIWEMNQEGQHDHAEIVLEENQAFYFLIWRHQLEMRIDSISATEWHVLTWIQNECTLAQICANAEKTLPHVSVSELFPHFVTKGWIAGFRIY